MYRLTVKNLWAHKVRFLLTGLAVVLGVAFMAGTMVLTDTMNKTFGDLFSAANRGVDVVVSQPVTNDPNASAGTGAHERIPAKGNKGRNHIAEPVKHRERKALMDKVVAVVFDDEKQAY